MRLVRSRGSQGCYLFLALLVASITVYGQERDLPDSFAVEAFKHVEVLADNGCRKAGSENEWRAAKYVAKQLQATGIDVEVEHFEFDCFEWSEAEFKVGGIRYEPEVIGFNPYEGKLTHAGEMTLLAPDLPEERFQELELADAVIVAAKTDSPSSYFRLLPKTARLIVLLREDEYQELAEHGERKFELRVNGSIRRLRSANVIGTLRAPQPTLDEIIVSAHLDSYKNSPGADDNGSGIGVVIELARYFGALKEERTTNLKFVAFGAEEVGVLGARKYLSQHKNDLERCRLVFNIDRVGGSGTTEIEVLGGIRGIPAKTGCSQVPALIADKAWEGLESGWILNAPEVVPLLSASNRPPWLVNAIGGSIEETGLEVSWANSLGGDSLAFSQAGIVASGMVIGGNQVHGPKDVPSQINTNSLERSGLLVSTLLLKLMEEQPWQLLE